MSQLQVSHLSKAFGKMQILNTLSFSCETGEIIGIFGRNGSGKSSLLNAVMGTLKVDSICIEIDGNVLEPSEVIESRKIAYLPQDPFLPEEMKVRDVIPLMFPKGEEQDKIFYSTGVAAFDSKKVGHLSAGQSKYLEVLLLAHLPHAFLLLDEPFSMVEPLYIEEIKKLLCSLKATKGLVITDHYYRDVLEICNRSLILKEGEFFKVKREQDLIAHKYLKERIE